MRPTLSVTWNDKKGRLQATLTAFALLFSLLATPVGEQVRAASARMVSVIVRETPRAGQVPERLVEELGGTLGDELAIIDGFTATVPDSSLVELERSPAVLSVTPDARIRLTSILSYEAEKDPNSLFRTAQEEIQASEFYNNGYTGKGVGVALIDSGVVPVEGLATPGKVVNGPDLSFESQTPALTYLDTFGHGTHMAGIIAGRDPDTKPIITKSDKDRFVGIAPDAHIVSVKVANAVGAADVSQVIAGIDWVVAHKDDPGLNIRILNLSFGTDGVQDYVLDPLAFAVEAAWHRGLVVVVAAGNRGYGSTKLNDPAYDPYVIAVGAAKTDGKYGINGDAVADFSSRGDATRGPDLVAPGISVPSLRAPGSFVDDANPQGVLATRLFRGSGTSQSAAIVSGAAALLLQQRPGLTPDQVKALLMSTTNQIPGATAAAQGAGLIDLKRAYRAATPAAVQTWPRATGLGSLELARGTAHVTDGEVVLTGEQDIFGAAWDATTWSALAALGATWSGGDWLGKTWSGGCWCGSSWAGKTWSGATWSGATWSGKTWSGATWSGKTWSGTTWSGTTWSGATWSGATWSGATWSGSTWSDAAWSGASWG